MDLRNAGITPGDRLMVHSSLRSIGHVEGGPAAVVEALRQSVSPGGAVYFPALTFDGSVTEFLREHKSVDLRDYPSRNGAICKSAGERSDAIRSLHPTHSVIGLGEGAAKFLTERQSGQGPCGTDSPFYRLAVSGGKIALIGVHNSASTTLHCVEEIAAPYIFNGESFDVITTGMDGRSDKITVKGYTTNTPRNFTGIEPRLLDEGIMIIHRLGRAELRIIEGREFLERVTAWVREDPHLLAKV
ncbi:MAG: AAC(3) family N-acetyltransferase [Phycisphaerae bacterium]|nr:AAC(3) family N-acetyltransferase [Phycisphaerae bacterium]